MPLRLRSVVPYTLPGVLVLIGWWWFTSRKKERLVSQGAPEAPPTPVSLKTSQAEGSNGLVEKGTVHFPPEVDCPSLRPAEVNDLSLQYEGGSQFSKTAPSLDLSLEDAIPPLCRASLVEFEPSDSTLPSHEDQEFLAGVLKEHTEPEAVSSLERRLDEDSVPSGGADLPPQASKISGLCTAAPLSDAERPEPEGEVAKHQGFVHLQHELLCPHTPSTSSVPSESDTLETPPSVENFHQHILTSTPTGPAPSADNALQGGTEEEQLELLAAGLITGVISAASQEVLGVSSCRVTDSSRPGEEPPPQEEAGASLHSQLLMSSSPGGCRDVAEEKLLNGCSATPGWGTPEASVPPTDDVQVLCWSSPPHKAPPTLKAKEKGGERVTLTEDSACSTCHSEDGVSSEELQSSAFDRPAEAVQVSHLSEGGGLPQPNASTEESSIKRLNGISLGTHGTCDADTDQSGGSDVNSMDSVDSGFTMGAGEGQASSAISSGSGLVIWEIEVPNRFVGRLIGKQGRYVSYLKQSSGAKIYISTLPYTQEFQICHIEGEQQQVDKALSLIGKKFKDLDLTNLYAPPPPPLTLPSLPMTSWLLLPSGVTVEVIVVNIVSAGHIFVQQHTHPTYHALRSLDQQMFLCYSQPGTPALPSPAEVGVICAAPAGEGAWWRAQVITFYKESNEVEIRYVDYGGYDRVKIDALRQIRSDFVTLPFQGAEVLLDNIAPLPGEDRFSSEATTAFEEITRGVALLAQVSNYDNNTGLPLVHLWNMLGEEVVSVNRTLAERGLAVWVDGF
ncbi:A kinase (PRKA) anchor protein 1b isoform X2 [Oryzias melastigma]|nr:A kinase (PRKA) anchor protein 1b isoform X2 [Oryzias melastigma]XP_024153660.1 A kinase (PRKA) anchor protein 1b isoform X2 [Oryzias melastigma]XP_024153661.1 A kinase (PRKA) anchor protein 1b isoform X2 [Oryzias melastigma]XP_024153662.1 A kinase (PRKA) anchor protein 1b isoform X2 [Oryzias melastigma]